MLWGEWREGGEKRKKKLNQPVVYSYSASFIISLPDRVSPPHPFNIILFWVSFVVKPPKWRVWLQRGVLLVSGNVLDLFVLQALQVERICVSSCRSEVNYFSPFFKKKSWCDFVLGICSASSAGGGGGRGAPQHHPTTVGNRYASLRPTRRRAVFGTQSVTTFAWTAVI